MKEFSIEEKAKRYDEAIKIAKSKIKNDKDHVLYEDDITEIFSELKESEDKRIRKRIIDALHGDVLEMSEIKEAVAWLEKQGEQEQDINIQINPSEYINDMGGNGCYLKNVTQVSAWSEEDEEMFDAVIANIQFTQKTHNHEVNQIVYEREIDWLKSLKERVQPKQEWKQENTDDLTDFENAMMHIGGSFFGDNAGLDPNDTNAIKEQANLLLELVPKQEWSEEDGNRVNRLIAYFEDKESFTAEDDIVYANWLKSLRHQNTWKPSELQIEALAIAIRCGIKLGTWEEEALKDLIEQLKKLRKE